MIRLLSCLSLVCLLCPDAAGAIRPGPDSDPPVASLYVVGPLVTPPVELKVERPDGTVWSDWWPSVEPMRPVLLRGLYHRPGRYRMTVEIAGDRVSTVVPLHGAMGAFDLGLVYARPPKTSPEEPPSSAPPEYCPTPTADPADEVLPLEIRRALAPGADVPQLLYVDIDFTMRPPRGLRLEQRPPVDDLRWTVINDSRLTVYGDGYVGWFVTRFTRLDGPHERRAPRGSSFCWRMNPVGPLASGERTTAGELPWLGGPVQPLQPGRHRVTVGYKLGPNERKYIARRPVDGPWPVVRVSVHRDLTAEFEVKRTIR